MAQPDEAEAEEIESADIDGGWREEELGVNVFVLTAAWPRRERECGRGQSRRVCSGMGGVWRSLTDGQRSTSSTAHSQASLSRTAMHAAKAGAQRVNLLVDSDALGAVDRSDYLLWDSGDRGRGA